jgi:hypothetical protein
MPSKHPKVPATSANREEDHIAKLKLNEVRGIQGNG